MFFKVGYGDMYPTSVCGRILGIMAAVCGLLMVALPVSVVATNFSMYYSYAKARISLPPKKKVKYAKEANNFLGQPDTQQQKSANKLKPNNNKIAPETPSITPNLTPVHHVKPIELPVGNTLPPLGKKISKFNQALDLMRDRGMLQKKDKKMDLATLVMVLSSKGDWSHPKEG